MLTVFSGLDGAGKSTQIDILIESLQKQGGHPIYLWTRGGYTPLFGLAKTFIRWLSRGRVVPASGHSSTRTQAFSNPWKRRLWLTLAILDLIFVYGLQVRWQRWRQRSVICDRYIWDTLVDFRLNFPQEQIESWVLWRLLDAVTPQPDTAFLLLIPVTESVRRSQLKNEPFPDSAETLAKRLAQYETLAKNGYWLKLDGRSSISELATTINNTVFPAATHTGSDAN